jgi:CspA family cold shock protein
MFGTIKRLVQDRGFGFISGENGSEYFFHRDQLRGGLTFETLKAGARVSFDSQEGPKGPRAANIEPA